MGSVSGEIQKTNDNWDKFNIQVNGGWYSTKEEWAPKPRPGVGDVVEFDDGGKNYIQKCRIVGKGSPSSGGGGGSKAAPASSGSSSRTFPVGKKQPERAINRQNALTNAVAFCSGSECEVSYVIEVARQFEAYTTGDLDNEAAEQAAKDMGV